MQALEDFLARDFRRQLAQRRIQRLLRHAQYFQQRIDGDLRVASDKIQNAVMHPPEAAAVTRTRRRSRSKTRFAG